MDRLPVRKTARIRSKGFTLVEVLICLMIIAEIATFTIPKVLSSQQNNTYRSIAKEAAGTISAAFLKYQLTNGISSSTTVGLLTQYMNYVAVDTASSFDYEYGSNTGTCGTGNQSCLRLHNGAILNYTPFDQFNGTASTNAVYFYLDPDGTTDGTTNGPGKSVLFWLYANGRITSWGNADTNTTTYFGGSTHTYNASPSSDPSWFAWN